MKVIKKIKNMFYDRAIQSLKSGSYIGGYINQRIMKESLRKLLSAGRVSPDEYIKYLMDIDYRSIEDSNEREIIIFGLTLLKEDIK